MAERICTMDDCTKPPHGRGLCGMHYRRQRVNGSPDVVRFIKGDDEARFWASIDKAGPLPALRPELGPCWVWTGATTEDGYGRFIVGGQARFGGKTVRTHRWAYQRFVGPVADDLHVDHLCRNRACARFDGHLEVVTQQVNQQRRAAASACAMVTA